MITFSPDQQVALLDWLQTSADNGLTLQDLIEGLISGTLTSPVSLTEQDIDFHRLSQEV